MFTFCEYASTNPKVFIFPAVGDVGGDEMEKGANKNEGRWSILFWLAWRDCRLVRNRRVFGSSVSAFRSIRNSSKL